MGAIYSLVYLMVFIITVDAVRKCYSSTKTVDSSGSRYNCFVQCCGINLYNNSCLKGCAGLPCHTSYDCEDRCCVNSKCLPEHSAFNKCAEYDTGIGCGYSSGVPLLFIIGALISVVVCCGCACYIHRKTRRRPATVVGQNVGMRETHTMLNEPLAVYQWPKLSPYSDQQYPPQVPPPQYSAALVGPTAINYGYEPSVAMPTEEPPPAYEE